MRGSIRIITLLKPYDTFDIANIYFQQTISSSRQQQSRPRVTSTFACSHALIGRAPEKKREAWDRLRNTPSGNIRKNSLQYVSKSFVLRTYILRPPPESTSTEVSFVCIV